MNIALILAGGSGTRMHQSIPKQFMSIYDKPVIVYTLEAFENHPAIDVIIVSCLCGWELILSTYAKQYGITKLKHIVPGGPTGMQSIRNGLDELKKHYQDDDIVLIHDSIRPMVSSEMITCCIVQTKEFGSAISCIPCHEAMMATENQITSKQAYPREQFRRAQAPQGFPLGRIYNAHLKAEQMGIKDSVASSTLMVEVGEEVYFSIGSEKNIKLTTPDDIDIFKALLQIRRHEQK